MSDQSGNCTGQHQKCSENVRCLTVISCGVVMYVGDTRAHGPHTAHQLKRKGKKFEGTCKDNYYL